MSQSIGLGSMAAVERSAHAIQVAAIDHLITLESEGNYQGVATLLQLLDLMTKVIWPAADFDPRVTAAAAKVALATVQTGASAPDDPGPEHHCIPPWVHVGNRCVYDPNSI